MIGAYAISKEPLNEYLKLHSIPGRDTIKWLSKAESLIHTKYFQTLQSQFNPTLQPLELQAMVHEIVQTIYYQ